MGIHQRIDLRQDIIAARRTASSKPLASILTEHATTHGVTIPRVQTAAIGFRSPRSGFISGSVIIHRLVAASQPHGLWMPLLNVLRHKADPGAGLALVFEAHNVLPIKGFTNGLNVMLQPLIREER